ncbi:N-acetylglucosamine-6-phosphate deacetylase [Vagococcus penaei]|uniref:N-acetylglucosamine-6-phosphate deacetylase n=1 Tax=Vagococcus penaei TaxID=633807 RepID=A0A1Q2D4S4_9ENTE|nr:N-acetylglucosamine-6-phosphate deacetylase [Vagococcus penaei]AQP53406.1 N-acetylglucosamine-6-phosphate deacetylase [Vagococcus penaei]RST98632.1 N-acetylglucosamine-6-phosphate deacetylase [Vagococcus penaei]
MHYFVKAKKIFLENRIATDAYLEINEGKFGNVYQKVPSEAVVIDVGDNWVGPGLVDTHIHGFHNFDVMDNSFDSLEAISKGLLGCGVTSFLPTTLTSSFDLLNAVAKTISEHHNKVSGAKIQGIFFEGPYFTEKHKGAQNPSYFKDPSMAEFRKWQTSANGMIKKIALAPERPGAAEFTQELVAEDVTVSLAHSEATYQEAQQVVDAGASIFVHTFNGMSGLSHRDPGMVGCAMNNSSVYNELICDGHHVHPVAVNILTKLKTPEKIALITDCMRAGGMPDGHYKLGEFPVEVKDGAARLESNGSLAGSVLTLIDGVKNVSEWEVATVADALNMASIVPAKSVGIDTLCGSISSGKAADFIIITPDIELLETYLDGNLVFSQKGN